MPFKAFLIEDFKHKHESDMFWALAKTLKKNLENRPEPYILAGNVSVDGVVLDTIFFHKNAVTVIEMKNYRGEVVFDENAPWRVGGAVVKGGAQANPFRQVLNSRWALVDLLKEILPGIDGVSWEHVSGIVLFRGPIKFDKRILPKRISRWFHVADLSRIARLCSNLHSNRIALDRAQVDIIAKKLGIEAGNKINPDNNTITKEDEEGQFNDEKIAAIIAAVQKEIKGLKQTLVNKLRSDFKGAKDGVAFLGFGLAKANENIDRAQKSLADIDHKIEAQQGDSNALSAKLDSVNEEVNELKESFNEVKQNMEWNNETGNPAVEQENQTLVNNVKKLIDSNSQLNDAIGEMIASIKHLGQDAPKAREAEKQTLIAPAQAEDEVAAKKQTNPSRENETDVVNQTNGANITQESDMKAEDAVGLLDHCGDFGAIIFCGSQDDGLAELKSFVTEKRIYFGETPPEFHTFDMAPKGMAQYVLPNASLLLDGGKPQDYSYNRIIGAFPKVAIKVHYPTDSAEWSSTVHGNETPEVRSIFKQFENRLIQDLGLPLNVKSPQ